MAAPGLDERFIGALHDALAADIDPRSGRHLAEHHQSFAVEFVKMLPRGPMRNQVRIGDQNARRSATRLSALSDQAALEFCQCSKHVKNEPSDWRTARDPSYLSIKQELYGTGTGNLTCCSQGPGDPCRRPRLSDGNLIGKAPSPKSSSQRTPRWREMDSNYWYRGTKAVDFRSTPGIAEDRRGS